MERALREQIADLQASRTVLRRHKKNATAHISDYQWLVKELSEAPGQFANRSTVIGRCTSW